MAPACVGGAPGRCEPGLPAPEACNDLDDDCDGAADEGCDDDGDGYCDARLLVQGAPLVCALGLERDCDDDAPDRHPGRAEVCDDQVDNDCDELADYLDFNGCVPITASFQDADGVVTWEHGTSPILRALLTPPTLAISRKWSIAGAEPPAACAAADVSFVDGRETEGSTERRVSVIDSPEKLVCDYTLELAVGSVVADVLHLRTRNSRPRVDRVVGAILDEPSLVLRAAAGRDPRLTALEPADDDQPVTVAWGGRDVAALDCLAPCEGLAMNFRTPPAAGSYLLSLNARDGFDGIARARGLRVEAAPCVWLRAGGTGNGGGPGTSNAYGDLAVAAAQAAARGAQLCIAGSSPLTLDAPLELAGDLVVAGGFGTAGVPMDSPAVLRLGPGVSLGFAPGARAVLHRLRLEAAGPAPILEVHDASPRLEGVDLVLAPGSGGRAIDFVASDPAGAELHLASVNVRGAGPSSDTTGLSVVGRGGLARVSWSGTGSVELTGCRGLCRGVAVEGRAFAALSADRIEVQAEGAGSRAYAVEIKGDGRDAPGAELRSLALVAAHTSAQDPADETVSVRLSRSRGVRVVANTQIGPGTQVSGRVLSAAIADGSLRPEGALEAGASEDLAVLDNRIIAAGRASYAWEMVRCEDEPAAREGTAIGPGILLVGTSSAYVARNGNVASRDNAISGAASTAYWTPGQRRLPPLVPALWTVDTRGVRVEKNELRAGVLALDPICPPVQVPWLSVVKDGLGPSLDPALGSRDLRLERNGIGSGRRTSFDGLPGLGHAGTRAVELAGTVSALVANDYVSATRGRSLVALWLWRVGQAEVWNNVFEVEAKDPPAEVREKLAVVLEELPPASLLFANNVVLVREDEADPTEPVALVDGSQGTAFLAFEHNLLFVEAAERGAPGSYVLSGGVRYDRAGFPAFVASIKSLDRSSAARSRC